MTEEKERCSCGKFAIVGIAEYYRTEVFEANTHTILQDDSIDSDADVHYYCPSCYELWKEGNLI